MHGDKKQLILQLFDQGTLPRDIYKQNDVTKVYVYRLAKQQKIALKRDKYIEILKDIDEKSLVEDYKQYSIKELSQRYRIDQGTVKRILKKHDIVLRKRGERISN